MSIYLIFILSALETHKNDLEKITNKVDIISEEKNAGKTILLSEHDIEENYHLMLSQRIREKAELALQSNMPYDWIKQEILVDEMKRYYISSFKAVESDGYSKISPAARLIKTDRSNFKRDIKYYGFNLEDLMIEAEELESIEIPIAILEKGISYYKKELLIRKIDFAINDMILELNDGIISQAARQINVDRNNYKRKLKELGIDPNKYRTRY